MFRVSGLVLLVCLLSLALAGCGSTGSSQPLQAIANHGSIASLSVTPGSISCAAGVTLQVTVTAIFSDGFKQDMTSQSNLKSSDPSIAVFVNTSGMLKCVATGDTTITVDVGGKTASAPVHCTPATLVSIIVKPSSFTCTIGAIVQVSAFGTFTDGSEQAEANPDWNSDDPSIAAVVSGKVTCNSPGKVNIKATVNGVTGSAQATVTSATVVSISISPLNVNCVASSTVQLVVKALLSDGSTQDMTNQANMNSSDPSVAAFINASGLLKCFSPGTVKITATVGGVSSSSSATCTKATVVSLSVTPPSVTCSIAEVLQLNAVALLSDGTNQDVTRDADWTSDDPLIAIVNTDLLSSGKVSCLLTGNTIIKAKFSSELGSATVTVK